MSHSLANRPTLDGIDRIPIGEIAAMPPEVLALLQIEAGELLDAAKRRRDWIDAAIGLRYGEAAAERRRAEGKDAGTVRLSDGPVTVIADLPKKVSWDQDRLAEMAARIAAAGDDPAEYLEQTWRISERRYAAWPAAIRAGFEPARTVATGKPTFRLVIEEKA